MSLRTIDFFGLPVTFRVEARKNAVAVILSLRSRNKERIDGNGTIVYEHPPRIVRFTDEASVEKRVWELIPECLQRAFDPATREGRALREKFAQRLPLAAVIAVDFDRVAQSMKWANSTQKEHERSFATVYKGNIIKNLIMDCQSYTKYRPNETTGGIFVSWRRKEELPTGA